MVIVAVENVIKRYSYITEAIRQGLDYAEFYIGNRKQVIHITEEIKTVCTVIEDVLKKENNALIKQMLKGMLAGELDIFIMEKLPYSKNSYYDRKQAIIEKIYRGCIHKGLVSYNEILEEEIAV
ncbi:MAG: hypothetical protein K2O89_07835 [Clostridia bacterium]|nr:hypothetical protein [Clostridia bacterium]